MSSTRVVELRQVMEKFAEFYHQKLEASEDIPTEPMRIKTKCRVLEHYMEDVKMQIDHFINCVEKWDSDSIEIQDRLKRTLRENCEKTDFLEKQLRNSESQRQQIELAVQELGVRCESLEESRYHSENQLDSLLSDIGRISASLNSVKIGDFSDLKMSQDYISNHELSRVVKDILALECISREDYSCRSLGVQSEIYDSEKFRNDEELGKARREILLLDEKLRELKDSLHSASQHEQELINELHCRDREIAVLRTSANNNTCVQMLQDQVSSLENEKNNWRSEADSLRDQLGLLENKLRCSRNEDDLNTSYSRIQRELHSERERYESLENTLLDRTEEMELYRNRYEELMAENNRLENLIADNRHSYLKQEEAFKLIANEREENNEVLRQEIIHVTTLLRDQRDRALSAEDGVRSLTIQLDALRALKAHDQSINDENERKTAPMNPEELVAKAVTSRTEELQGIIRKIESQLEKVRHEKLIAEEEMKRVKSRSNAEQTSLQNHIDRIKDELRAHEQASNKMRTDMRVVWEEKLRSEQQIRELLDSQAVDHERNKSLSSLLQQREDEASNLRNEVASLSEQVGEKDGIISQLRAELSKYDELSSALQRDADNACEMIRIRDNQLAEVTVVCEKSCEAANATKKELMLSEEALKRMTEDFADLRQKAADFKVEAERERTRALSTESQIAKYDSDRVVLEQQLANLESEASRLRNEVIELNDKLVHLDREQMASHEVQEKLRIENNDLAQAVDMETKERKKFEMRTHELEMAVHLLEEQVQAYRHDVSVRDQAILRLRAETDQAVARCKSANEEMETKDSDVRRVAQRMREQQLELREAHDNLAVLEERLESTEARISEVLREKEVAIQDTRNAEKVIDQMRKEALLTRTEQDAENDRFRQANDLLVVEHDAAKADISELSLRLEHAREEIIALSQTNSDIQVNLHQLTARCRQKELLSNEQASTISDLRTRHNEASELLEQLKEEDRHTTMELETMRERCSDLSERLRNSESKCDEFERSNCEMKCRIGDLETIVIRMEADLQQSRIDLRNSKQRQHELEVAIIQLKEVIDTERNTAESVSLKLKTEELANRELNEKVSQILKDNSTLEESYSQMLADFRCYETDHRFSNSDVAERDMKIEGLEAEIDQLSMTVSSSSQKMSQFKASMESYKNEIEMAHECKEKMHEEVSMLEEKLMCLRQESESQKLEWENVLKSRDREIVDLKRQLSDATSETRVAREGVDSNLERIRSLEIDIAAISSDLNQREDVITQLESVGQQLRVELDSARFALKESEARVNLMLAEVETAKREASDARQAGKHAVSEQASAVQRAQVAEERASVSEAEMNAKVGECVRLEGQIRRFQSEMRSLQERLQDSEEDRSNLRENLSRVKTELAQVRENLARLTQENALLQQHIAKTEVEFVGVREQHKLSANQLSHQDQIMQQLQDDLKQERAKNVEASRRETECRRVTVELRESLSNHERQVRDLQNRLSSRDHAVEDAQRELAESQAKLKAARDEAGELEIQLRAGKVSQTSAEHEAQALRDRVEVLERKVSEAMNELDRTRDSLRMAHSIASEREQDVSVLQREILNTRNQALDVASQIKELNQQLSDSQQEISRLRDHLAIGAVQLSKAEEYAGALKSQLASQTGSNAQVRDLQARLIESEQLLANAQSESEHVKSEIKGIIIKYEEAVKEIKLLKETLAAEKKENREKSKAEAVSQYSNQTKMSERQKEQSQAIAKLSSERDNLLASLTQAESTLNDKEVKILEMRKHITEQDGLIKDLLNQCSKQSSLKHEKSSNASSTSSSSGHSSLAPEKSRISIPTQNQQSASNDAVGTTKIPVATSVGKRQHSRPHRSPEKPLA